MIQSLRENLSGGVAFVLVALIAIPLAFFGIESIFLSGVRVNEVAKVNGEVITQLELEQAVAGQVNQIMSYLGADADPSLIDTDRIRPSALNQLIEQKTLLSKAKQANLGVSDTYLAQSVRSMSSFQVGGQFNQAIFRNFLLNYGYTASTFMETLAQETIANQLLVGVRATTFATQKDLQQRIELVEATRSYQYLTIPEADIIASIEIPEEDVQSYFDFYKEDFREPEKVSLAYVSLSPESFMASTANRADLSTLVLERYELLKTQQGDQKRVSHILLEVRDGKSVADQVTEVRSRLSSGETFATLASEYSADIGSANFGGDLGFTQGETFPAAFEAAVASLAVGAVSEPVVTEAGTHLITVTDEIAVQFELENEYAPIELEVRQELAADAYANALDELRELAFSTDDIDQLRQNFSASEYLTSAVTEAFSRETGSGIASDARVRSIGFSDVVMQSKLNSEVIELSGVQAIVVHLNEYFPSAIPTLDSVRSAIVSRLQKEEAATRLQEIAISLEAEVSGGVALDSVAEREGYLWQSLLDQPRSAADGVGQLVFSALVDVGLPITGSGQTPDGNFHVYRISDVQAGQLENQTDAQLAEAREQVALERSSMEWMAYVASLQANSKIVRKVDYSVPVSTEL